MGSSTPRKRRSSAPRRLRRWLRRAGLTLGGLVALVLLSGAAGALWLRAQMREALPQVQGTLALLGLEAPVEVARDAAGVPVLRGRSRLDVARATGFVHGQDRFFQMDLLRRRSAGELAELLGGRALEMDRAHRLHRLRDRAEELAAEAPEPERTLLEAYSDGVNAGLASLEEPPFEYLVLRAEPRPWSPVDSYLVVLTMFLELQDEEGDGESAVGLLHDLYPRGYFEFLTLQGTPWDAPLVGGPLPVPPVPGPDVYDARSRAAVALSAHHSPPDRETARAAVEESTDELLSAASSAWALAGRHTARGGALLATDLHLPLGIPNLWYRAVFVWPEEGEERRIVGATLPGAPLMVVGSNGAVAWGFTDSQIDTNDLVILETEPGDPDRYRTPDGLRPVERLREEIRLAGDETVEVEVPWTVWGPVLGPDHAGRQRAFHWIVHEDGAVDFGLMGLEGARTVEEALDVANRSGLPALNFLAADRHGRIGWTLAGRIPRRKGYSGRLPTSWADGSRRWDGLLPPEEVPRLVDPEAGRLWSANNRAVDGEALALLGDDGYLLGARARQIRDRLRTLDRATEADMLAVQLDDRALFLSRWQALLLKVLSPEALEGHPRRAEARRFIEDWGARAAVDSVGYRLVAGARLFLVREVFGFLTGDAVDADPDLVYHGEIGQHEGPLWRLVTERPRHLLNPRYESWDEQVLGALDDTLDYLLRNGGSLAEMTWGRRNTAAIFHPLALPGLRGFLGMRPDPLPGDVYMPRVQRPSYGASLRMVVSPGREGRGIFHMPGGQSGNPLSPRFREGHDAWVQGRATPLLPDRPVDVLMLEPAAGSGQ